MENKMTKSLELLAPAGNTDIGIAAIDHGADAVYIGAPKFSARAEAGVGLEDIDRLVRHAHFFNAKVYLALNTILSDAELPEALEIIREAYRLGVDGLILQDVGLLELDLPPIPLIASTQMHNDTAEKVRFLETVGFKRVILARELSLEEISAIREKTTVALESFVHGALCVSYSGRCYMSQAVAGRSGNRGVCAQPCRSRYTLTDGDGRVLARDKFLLSLKDLCLLHAIPDLAAAGITSFKIEGRYKGMDYVKNITAAFRGAIDRFIADHPEFRRSSSGESELSFTPAPEKTFNRGYTSYFLSGRKEKIASIRTQKSMGEYVGTVTRMGKDFFSMDGHDLRNGDGLCFFTKQETLEGFRVNRVEKDRIYPNTLKSLAKGTELYRNYNIAFDRILKKTSADRTVAVKMEFFQDNEGIRLTAVDEDGNREAREVELPFEAPRDAAGARKQIEKHLSRTGGTLFRTTRITVSSSQPGFVPPSILNGLRREVLDALARSRAQGYQRREIPFIPNDIPYPETHLDFSANVYNNHARRFYKRHGIETIDPAFESLTDFSGRQVMTTRYCLRRQLDLCTKDHRGKKLPKAPFRIGDGRHSYRLEFDCLRCRMKVFLLSFLAICF
jgi:putative protease